MANTSINDFLGAVALRGISLLKASESNQKPDANTIVELCKRSLSSPGNASGLALSFQFWELYEKLDDPTKEALFIAISAEFSANLEDVATVATQYIETQSPEVLKVLSAVAAPKYAELISRLNQTPASTLKIVHIRADLLRFLRQNPSLKPLDEVFSQVV
ncbi:malonyl-CoA decarboxylase N-terminal domain-containing protein [Falsihalocynthiibacter arcticus]|uniref:Malonyl-CoA decarboxylase N-terminal domain-containing protein n=1 Tax=Falsihalocynthiibacter arcticus TaxID=1579316 RepID=A0A126V151_9RHOB|nr:malonyl-CoA decarboxylase N-terminal domain-containing protein [Falsihalocynthiibacter arcticus]AML52023.1 hypothetical protein RC74_12745 [Falsihalocynthiibacter arcticus]